MAQPYIVSVRQWPPQSEEGLKDYHLECDILIHGKSVVKDKRVKSKVPRKATPDEIARAIERE